jgi:hypothetical protein
MILKDKRKISWSRFNFTAKIKCILINITKITRKYDKQNLKKEDQIQTCLQHILMIDEKNKIKNKP